MQIFLFIAGGGILLLDLLVTVTILFGPAVGINLRGYGIEVLGTRLSSEIELLVLFASCSFSGFLVLVLAFRQRRIGLESEGARRDFVTKPGRQDSESKKALRELKLNQAVRHEALFNAAAAGMLVLGLASATVIFLTKIGRLLPPLKPDLPRGTISLWLMFITGTLLGVVAAWLAQQKVIAQITLLKKQFWDESPTTRQARPHRRRARLRWRFLETQICYQTCDTPRWPVAHRRRARFRWHF